MNFYYTSNHTYQIIYSEPVYRQLSGTFLAWTYKTKLRLKTHFISRAIRYGEKIPAVKKVRRSRISGFMGVMIANSLHKLGYDRNELTTVLMYHGTSDKIPRVPQKVANQFGYYFLSGPKNENKLAKAAGIDPGSPRLVHTGNWMFDRFVNRECNPDKMRRRFNFADPDRPMILYAPTWKYGNGTLFLNFENLVNTIPEKYNLVIRPHYAERRYISKLKKQVPERYKKHVHFSSPADIENEHFMDNLAAADLLLSDTSSMLYEYLITKRPIIICDTDTDEVSFEDDGMSISHRVDHYKPGDDIVTMIDRNLADKSIPNDMGDLLDKCFFFNDGKSTRRCVDALLKIAAENSKK